MYKWGGMLCNCLFMVQQTAVLFQRVGKMIYHLLQRLNMSIYIFSFTPDCTKQLMYGSPTGCMYLVFVCIETKSIFILSSQTFYITVNSNFSATVWLGRYRPVKTTQPSFRSHCLLIKTLVIWNIAFLISYVSKSTKLSEGPRQPTEPLQVNHPIPAATAKLSFGV